MATRWLATRQLVGKLAAAGRQPHLLQYARVTRAPRAPAPCRRAATRPRYSRPRWPAVTSAAPCRTKPQLTASEARPTPSPARGPPIHARYLHRGRNRAGRARRRAAAASSCRNRWGPVTATTSPRPMHRASDTSSTARNTRRPVMVQPRVSPTDARTRRRRPGCIDDQSRPVATSRRSAARGDERIVRHRQDQPFPPGPSPCCT